MWRARIECVLAGLFAVGALATFVWPTWIESLTGLEPDNSTGEAEWWLVLVLGLAAAVASLLARRDFRLARFGVDGGHGRSPERAAAPTDGTAR